MIRCEICYACSQTVTWKGGPLMWMMPLHLHVNQKSNYYDDDVISLSSRSKPSIRVINRSAVKLSGVMNVVKPSYNVTAYNVTAYNVTAYEFP